MFRFLLKIRDAAVLIRDHDSEPLCFLHRNRHDCDGYVRALLLVIIEHRLVIHLINMISGENQYIVRIVCFDIINVLVNCIRRAGVPLRVLHLLIGRKYRDAADVPVEIPRNTDPDVRIQLQGPVLR